MSWAGPGYGKSITPILERKSKSVRQSRHIDGKGTGYGLSEEPSERVSRPFGFSLPPDPRELGEALWTARDIL